MENCDKQKGDEKEREEDNESAMEKCWHESYKGESKKWLIRDASTKMEHGPLSSTMKESYIIPPKELCVEKDLGKRRKFLMEKFMKEAAYEEFKKTTEDEKVILDYCTEYDGNFKADGFKPKDKDYTKNSHLFDKYPLYGSAPVSYYSFNQQKNPKEVLYGLTRITDNINVFKRNGQFSKPIAESLDFVEL